MSQLDILHILQQVKDGELEPEDAVTKLKLEPFQDLGFAKVGRRPKYYVNPTEDALLLRKEL